MEHWRTVSYNSRTTDSWGGIAALIAIVVFGLFTLSGVQTINHNAPYEAAETLGISNVQVSDEEVTLAFTSNVCGKGYVVSWVVTGTNAQDEQVSFTVCGGFYGRSSIRF